MPEIKHTFLKSKMNKDLDARLIPNGEYRDAQNLAISKSEGADVGALENIRGNIIADTFGEKGDVNLESIGLFRDTSTNRLFCFLTNFNDVSNDQLSNNSILFSGAKCYVAIYDANLQSKTTIISGNFLNFSKSHPISGFNILEDLMFWTDDRNQPRKINIQKALEDPSFYNSEDLISVSKYSPYKAIDFVENLAGAAVSTPEYSSILINEVDEFLPYHVLAPTEIIDQVAPSNDYLQFRATGPSFQPNISTSFDLSSYITFDNTSKDPKILVKNQTQPDKGEFLVFNMVQSLGNWTIALASKDDPYTRLDFSATTGLSDWNSGDVVSFSNINPNYNPSFTGDKDFLKDKFVRFSYRFQYTDGEYSLMAPFTQPAFIPKQYGDFLENDESKTKDSGVVEFFENQVSTAGLNITLPYDYDNLNPYLDIENIEILYKDSESNNIKIIESIYHTSFVNYIGAPITGTLIASSYLQPANTVDGTYTPICQVVTGNGKRIRFEVSVVGGVIASIATKYSGSGFKAGDKVIIPANELGYGSQQVTITIDSSNLKVARDTQFVYQYKSTKPYKVLPEKDTIRVYDRVPVRALAQEISGNRIMYGNYIDRKNFPSKIDYNLKVTNKQTSVASQSRRAYPTHTLKQNRTYQAGIVLMDRYGRSSNVILNEDIASVVGEGGKSSTIFSSYVNAAGYPLSWPGNSLKVIFNNVIPESINTGGLYSTSNPLGWYSYKVVVKQQQQEYYNVYTPGVLSGKVTWSPDYTVNYTSNPNGAGRRPNYTNLYTVSNIALLGDNINKVPRNLQDVGPLDTENTSSTILYNRVNPGFGSSGSIYNQQNPNDESNQALTISTIKQHRELGDWAVTKGQYVPASADNANFGSPLSTKDGNVTHLIISNITGANNGVHVNQSGSGGSGSGSLFDVTVAGGIVTNITCTNVSVPDTSGMYRVTVDHYVIGDKIEIDTSGYIGTGSGTLKIQVERPIDPWYPFYSNGEPPTETNVQFEDIFYKAGENPYVVELATNYRIGVTPGYSSLVGITNATLSLGIFETKPTYSNLDILWETSTSGLISDLNASIRAENASGNQASLSPTTYVHHEDDVVFSDLLAPSVQALDSTGNVTGDQFATMNLIQVNDLAGNDVTGKFRLVQATAGSPSSSPTFNIQNKNTNFVYLQNQDIRSYEFLINSTVYNQSQILRYPATGWAELGNIKPEITGALPFGELNKARVVTNNFYQNGGTVTNYNGLLRLKDFWDTGTSVPGAGNAGWVIIKGSNPTGKNCEVLRIDDEEWYSYTPQTGAQGQDTDRIYNTDPALKTFTLSNGSIIASSLRKSQLKVEITKIEKSYHSDFSVIEDITNGETSTTGPPFIVPSNSSRRIMVNSTHPPMDGGNNANTGIGAAIYKVTYKLTETFAGGLSSDEYPLYFKLWASSPF